MNQPINPYQPPQEALEPRIPQPRSPFSALVPYCSASGKAQFAIGATILSIILNVLMIGSLHMQIAMLNAALDGTGIDAAAAESNDRRQMAISWSATLSMLLNFIAILVWVYAAHKNLPALKPTGVLEFTPGWAVGWFFVPIMNLFKPFQAMRQLWNESDPEQLAFANAPYRPIPPATLVGWWWGLRIVGAIGGRIFSRAGDETSIEGLITISWTAIALAALLDVPMLVCQWRMIRTIQRNQEARHDLIERATAFAPAATTTSDNVLAQFR